jgi:hypothetical protein
MCSHSISQWHCSKPLRCGCAEASGPTQGSSKRAGLAAPSIQPQLRIKTASVQPTFHLLRNTDKSVVTPHRLIKIRWNSASTDKSTSSGRSEGHRVHLSVEAPEGVTVRLSSTGTNNTGKIVTFEGKYEDTVDLV